MPFFLSTLFVVVHCFVAYILSVLTYALRIKIKTNGKILGTAQPEVVDLTSNFRRISGTTRASYYPLE